MTEKKAPVLLMSSISSHSPLLAAIEAGGTKYVCAVGYDPEKPIAEVRFPTRNPEDTLSEAIAFFEARSSELGPIAAMGLGTFGPAVIDQNSLCAESGSPCQF